MSWTVLQEAFAYKLEVNATHKCELHDYFMK